MQHSLKRTIGRMHSCFGRILDASILSRHWQRLQWNIKYRVGAEQYVPKFETLLQRPHRGHLFESLNDFGEWNSLLEVGCGRGANLYLLEQRRPDARLAGVDISAIAIEDARGSLAKNGTEGATLAVADAANLRMFLDGSFDVVMTDAVLMYMPPTIIERSLEEMLRVAKLGLVLSTWHVDLPETPQQIWTYDEGCWVYDYRRLLSRRGDVSIHVQPYPAGVWNDRRWVNYGVLVRVNKGRRGEP